MAEKNANQHLSQMATLWSVVRQAHQGERDAMADARRQLLERYGGAIQRYLHRAAGNPEASDDLYQDFALRFVQGDFHRANPEKGRFRDYLKTVLYHLVVDFHTKKKKGLQPITSNTPEPVAHTPTIADSDRKFLASWRDDLLARTWKQLADLEVKTGQPFHAVLRFRAEHPDMRSPEMADQLSAKLGKSLNATAVRQTLHRARDKFAGILVDEVRESLDNPGQDELEQELIDLGLMEYCRPTLEKRAE